MCRTARHKKIALLRTSKKHQYLETVLCSLRESGPVLKLFIFPKLTYAFRATQPRSHRGACKSTRILTCVGKESTTQTV